MIIRDIRFDGYPAPRMVRLVIRDKIIEVLAKIGMYTNKITVTNDQISTTEFRLSDSAIVERGGMNVSPWSGKRRRNTCIEDFLLICTALNKMFDRARIDCIIESRLSCKSTIRVRHLDGAVDSDDIEKEIGMQIVDHSGDVPVRYEDLWRPEDYANTSKWWEKKKEEIESW